MTNRLPLILAALLSFFASIALAQQDLMTAKENGLVGERPDGLVSVVDQSENGSIKELVESVNRLRLAEYNKIAKETDAPIEAVQARAGRRIIQNLPSGQYFMDVAGRWRQK